MDSSFTLKHTNVAKGVACLLLLLHHLFYSEKSYELFYSAVNIGTTPLVSVLAVMGKVCVAMFLLLSGYGMAATIKKYTKQLQKNTIGTYIKISLKQLWKLWANYLIIFVVFVPWQHFADRWVYTNWWEFVLDLFGLSYCFGTTTMNATWWYMSVAIISYAVTPFFAWLVNNHKELAIALTSLVFMMFLRRDGLWWLVYYFVGYLIFDTDILTKLKEWSNKKQLKSFVLCFAVLILCAYLRYRYLLAADILFASVLIVITFLFVSEIKVISIMLEFLGKHSGNIFMFHSFIYLYNFRDIIYAPKYPALIMLFLLAVCLVISVLIELLKKYVGINKAISFVGESLVGLKEKRL